MKNYTEGDILITLRLLKKEKIGRKKVSDYLGLGEATIRTLFRKMESRGLISSTQQGQQITDKGRTYLDDVPAFTLPRHVDVGDLTLSEYNIGSLVRGAGHRIKDGIQIRDAAIIAGACGATTLISTGSDLLFPGESTTLSPENVQYLSDEFNPQEQDVFIIATAGTEQKAMRGLSGCLKLILNDKNKGL
jgi:predicted transcriptional regulator